MSAVSLAKSEPLPIDGVELEPRTDSTISCDFLEEQSDVQGIIGFAVPWSEDFYSPGPLSERFASRKTSQGSGKEPFCYGEEAEGISLFHPFFGGEEEAFAEEESTTTTRKSSISDDRVGENVSMSLQSDSRGRGRKSLFVHSSPTHFPDINRARKSAFGSIFLRTTGHIAEEATLLRTVAESNYSMLQSLLDSFDKILMTAPSETERKQMTLAYKESLLRLLEHHGIRRTYSDGSVHWDIYPITQSYLFSVQVGDHVHQTRNLSRIEDRIVTGPMQTMRVPHEWPTRSLWTGHWDSLGMAGTGTYAMPHGVTYTGKMRDGMFHDDDATLTYPNKFKALHCVFEKGKLIDCQFQFPDLLNHEKENWNYCKSPDRRFWSEVRNGLKSGKIAQKTELDPPRKIPAGCYDTNDGFYNPKSLCLLSPAGELLRVPVCKEDLWIKKHCRKGFHQPTDFRPDLFENWFNYDQDLINSILQQQDNFRKGKITYDDLQQFYADNNLLLPCSPYKKRKTASEIAMEEYIKSIPEPRILKFPKIITKYEGHKLPSEVTAICNQSSPKKASVLSANMISSKKSKSSIRFTKESKPKFTSSHGVANVRSSRISFKFSEDFENLTYDRVDSPASSEGTDAEIPSKRLIPEKYLKPQSILRPPFMRPSELKYYLPPQTPEKKPCLKKHSTSSESMLESSTEGSSVTVKQARDRRLKKFMREIIMEAATRVLLEERERHRLRLKWAQKAPQKSSRKTNPNESCLRVLEELYESIPDREEYCDSDPSRVCDLRKLAEDKYNILKYWGNRIFLLEFDEEKKSGADSLSKRNKPK